MNAQEAAKIQIDLPEEILRPGDLIQIQCPVPGGGEQVEIVLEVIARVQVVKSFESGKFQKIYWYLTTAQTFLTYNAVSREWLLVRHAMGKDDLTTPVNVFLLRR